MALMYPRVRLLLMVVGLGFGFINGAQAAGAGRAFPIESENYVIEKFQRINRDLEWDRTNFLTDLSGQYANCDSIRAIGKIPILRTTPEGESIAGYNDHKDGRDFHVDAVNVDLKIVIDSWNQTRVLHHQIMVARLFGCSVRPGCSGKVAVNCLFSPADDGNWPTRPSTTDQYNIIQPSTTRQSTQPSTTRQSTQPSTTRQHIQPSTTEPIHSVAQALTMEQHRKAERLTNKTWDDTLENLSGRETNCTMIGRDHWQFTKAQSFNRKLNFIGIHGYAVNNGTTEGPLLEILKKIGQNRNLRSTSKFGCSLFSDCKLSNGTLYVVVSCIFTY